MGGEMTFEEYREKLRHAGITLSDAELEFVWIAASRLQTQARDLRKSVDG